MTEKMSKKQEIFKISPIGHINKAKYGIQLKILEPFRPALKQLNHFSHLIVFWWSNRFDTERYRSTIQCKPPYAKKKLTGVFACRSPVRPNPIMITTCRILDIDEEEGVIVVSDIDAFEGTPIIDLKPYIPVSDRVKEVKVPEWLSDWPEWMAEDGFEF